MRIILIILLAAYGFYSCIIHASGPGPMIAAPKKYIDPFNMIGEGQSLLREGDLVVRLNQDPNSRYIKNFNRKDKSYSHAGIVLFEKGYPFIYHIVNGEENPGEKMRRDSLSHFADPRKNLAFGIFRYKLNDIEIKKIKALIRNWYKKGVRFDPEFDLDTDNKMYCSEMIMKALAKGTNNRIMAETTGLNGVESRVLSAYLQLPFSYTNNLRIVSIDNLYRNQYCEIIEKYNY
jgi:Permuted papain-like amidase enzyme, YaeF/YiiX, C92 family